MLAFIVRYYSLCDYILYCSTILVYVIEGEVVMMMEMTVVERELKKILTSGEVFKYDLK